MALSGACPLRLVTLCLLLSVSAAPALAQLDPQTRQLSRDIFQQLIEINTTDSVGSTTVAAKAMAQRLLDAGFPKEDVLVLGPNERKGNLVARIHGTGNAKPILFIGHLDVVEALRSDWTTDPFQFVEKDGYFYGRGTQDMKESDAVLVTTFIRLKKEGFRPDRDLILALTADEEGGKSNGVDWLLKNHRDLIDAAFVLNSDSGGVDSQNGKAVSFNVEATEKLYGDYQLMATSPGGHSSQPVPDNAIYHIADVLTRVQAYTFPFELNPVTRGYFARMSTLESGQTAADMKAILMTPPSKEAIARLSEIAKYNATMRTTCVATRLAGGHANNALPQTAMANVNCRILPSHSREETRQDLIRIIQDPKVSVRYVSDAGGVTDTASDAKGAPPSEMQPEVKRPLEKLVGEMWPGIPVLPVMETGASDGKYTIAAGMPTYGINGIDIDITDDRAHGKDERVGVDSYYHGVEFYYRFIKLLSGGKS
ncbi:MAG TPA: M20/M25/M40 family metallo-hydrolase [Acidobacteriaceae bacterium]|nr:M20/M25/M40 family metallo-hydrolase [Acidobacteriaceae bacterium]